LDHERVIGARHPGGPTLRGTLRNQSLSKASHRAIIISLPDWLMPRACNLPDLLAWSKVAYNQDMPHFTQIGPEPAMTRSP
jgi:hypothetical protein